MRIALVHVSIIDCVFALEEETPRTIWQVLRGLHRCDSDFVNALFLTPYSWTSKKSPFALR